MRRLLDLPAGGDGLTDDQVVASRAEHGANRLTPLPREPGWRKFLAKFDEPIIKILLGAALLSLVVDLFRTSAGLGAAAFAIAVAGPLLALVVRALRPWLPSLLFAAALALLGLSIAGGHPAYEGLAVMIAVVLATGVAFYSEAKSDREFAALNADKDELRVKVRRAGQVQTVPQDEVVVGDAVILESGDEVPADGRFLRANALLIDQSLLTGETEPTPKTAAAPDDSGDDPDEPGCAYRGTQVADGIGLFAVCEVGDATMLGQLASRLGDDDTAGRIKEKLGGDRALTPLQHKLQHLAELISRVGYLAAGLIFLALFVRGLFVGEMIWPQNGEQLLSVSRHLLQYFVYMVIVVVVAVPEGLPMSVTVSLALAMRKMTRANALVRRLVACETVGSATIICSDKTGTLTRNRMTVEAVEAPDQTWLTLNAALNATAALEEKHGQVVTVGNSTEGALLHWLRGRGVDYAALRQATPVVEQLPFNSERKRMTTVIDHANGPVLLVKGASELLLAETTHHGPDARPWQPGEKDAVLARVQEFAGRAMRTLAFAHAQPPGGPLVFDGFAAIRDPLRDDVRPALNDCRAAGIAVTMITGDNPETARAIAREAGLLDAPDALAMTSAEFNARSDEEVQADLPRLRVLARAKPLDKLRLVNLLQARGEVVAMTGDGTNDAPALKKADVGLAMGVSGTEVAKAASDIILLDDSFATIVRAVHWGRALYENIQRFLQFQLTINLSALVIAFLGPFFGIRPPFTVLQLLWINVIMDTLAALALCSEPPRAGLLRQPPKRRDENILTPAMRGTIARTAGFFVVVMLALLVGLQFGGWFAGTGPPSGDFAPLTARQVTIFFTTYVLFQVWNLINCRSLTPTVSGLARLGKNRTFLAVAAVIVAGQVLIVTFGGPVFQVEPLGVLDWLVIAAATSSVLLFAEVARRLRRGPQD